MSQKTTIVLGAGASVHYGFPTGNDLIDAIIKSAKWHNLYLIGGEYCLDEIYKVRKFAKLIEKYDPTSIDKFLSMHTDNAEIVEIGKKLIAHEIVKKQGIASHTRRNKENWYKLLYDYVFPNDNFLHRIENDEFRIITFNYDLSLEHFFNARLEQTPSLSQEDAWNVFLKFYSKVYHVYGSVYDYIRISEEGFECKENSEDRYMHTLKYAEKANHSTFQEASYLHNNIKVIGEERGDVLSSELMKFKSHIQQSSRIFILGFGFDSLNMKLIGLTYEHISNFHKNLFCTNIGNNDIINKKIRSLVQTGHTIKISNQSVYKALTEDFSF